MNDVIQKIYDIGIVPVIAIDDADKAVPLAKALVKGGLPAAEVTFRTAAAEEAIKRIVAEVPEMLVGAGTVLTVLALLLCAGWNNTAYYPSLAEMQSSLTIANSSSSEFTLKVMSFVSLAIPVVLAYIWYAWRSLSRSPITREEMQGDDHKY